jgi:cobalt-zinc-cadmium efflux system outer membrane protein
MKARNGLQQIWQELSATIGDPLMKAVPLAGDIEQLPQLDVDAALNSILNDSPEIRRAQAGIAQAEASLNRAQVEKIPDLELLGGLRNNRELLEVGQKPVGLEGIFSVGVKIPIFDRNQGGVQAAHAELTEAQREADRVRLSLRVRLSRAFKEYLNARDAAVQYKTAMLPRAEKAYDMYLIRFRQMAAAYPQALIAQRTLLDLQDEYNDTLALAWSRAIEIRGLLLTGALENVDSASGMKENE